MLVHGADPRGHAPPNNPAPFVLLDVVHERNVYPRVERVSLRTALVESDGALLVPTVEGLRGDKLTAFAPNTTGVPLNEHRAMQFMKQVFDIGELFNAAAKAALLTSALRTAAPLAFPALRYDDTKLAGLKAVQFVAAFSAAGKLKAIPEAMWLWAEALRLRGVKS